MKDSSQQQSMGKGFAILSAANIIVKLLSLIYVPVMVNLLGEEGNGVFTVTNQVYSFVYIIANSGIPVAISKFVSELSARGFHASALKSFKIARFFLILVGLLLSALMAAFARPIANLMNTERAYLGILVMSPVILVTAVLSAYRGYFQGRKNMVPTALTQIIEQIVHIGVSVFFVAIWIKQSIEKGVAGSSIGTFTGALVALLIIVVFFNRYVKSGRAVPIKSIKNMHSFKRLADTLIKYSIPITICTAVQYGGNLIDAAISKGRLLVSGLEPAASDAMYGLLGKYQQLINVPISLINALTVAMMPVIAGAIAVKNKRLARQKISYGYHLCYMIAIPASLAMTLLSNGIYTFLHFGRGVEFMMAGACTIIFTATVQIQTSILQSLGRLYYSVISLSFGIVLKIILNYILIADPSIRLYGAIISTYASMILTIIINQYLIKKLERIRVSLLRNMWMPFWASLAMVAVMAVIYVPLKLYVEAASGYIFNALLLVLTAGIGVFTYFNIMVKIGGITKEDICSISPKIYNKLPSSVRRRME